MIRIIEVTTTEQRRTFVEFPTKFYHEIPQYIPNTFDDDIEDWNSKKNPAFEYCEARCWLAYRDEEIVGRIGAILSHRANEKWNTNRMRFSQVDFIDDEEVSNALFSTVEEWAKEKGCTEVHGPLGFTDLDREGMLIEGFDRRSCFFTYYNYPYYQKHLERLGYLKDTDWIENLITIPQDDETYEHWEKLSNWVKKHCNVHELEAKNRLAYIPLLPQFFNLVNLCYAPLYGTVELTDAQIKKYAGKFAPLINPNLTCFVMNEKNEMIAMGVAAPSIADALKKHDGKYFPFGWADLLHSFLHNDTIDLLLIAVRPDYQKLGVNGIVINKILHGCRKMGIQHAETGPTLENNAHVLAQWKGFEVDQHKRRRCFVKSL